MHLATFLLDMHISWSEVEILLILVLAFTCIIDKSSEFMNKILNIRVLPVKSVTVAGLDGSGGCAVRLETRRSRVQPPPRSATFFCGDGS